MCVEAEEGALAAHLAREPSHRRRQLLEAGRGGSSALPQDPETRAGDGTQHVLAGLGAQVVLAVAEEGEVAALEPGEQLAGLGGLDVARERRLRQLGPQLA